MKSTTDRWYGIERPYTAEDVRRFPFRPNEIVDGVHNLLDVPLESRGDLGPDPTGSA